LIHLSTEHMNQIRLHGEQDFPYECCGALLGEYKNEVRFVREIRPMANVHSESHDRRFLISPDQMFALMKEERQTGQVILGFYHSHPDHPAQPSATDLDWASPFYIYIIVSVLSGVAARLTAWELREDRDGFMSVEIVVDDRLK